MQLNQEKNQTKIELESESRGRLIPKGGDNVMTGFHSPHPLYSLSTLSLLSLITLARTLSLFPLFLGLHQDVSS